MKPKLLKIHQSKSVQVFGDSNQEIDAAIQVLSVKIKDTEIDSAIQVLPVKIKDKEIGSAIQDSPVKVDVFGSPVKKPKDLSAKAKETDLKLTIYRSLSSSLSLMEKTDILLVFKNASCCLEPTT